MRTPLIRGRAAVELAAAQLRHYRWRTLLAVLGVAVAVLLVTLLSGLGHGVSTRGMAALDHANRDLWIGGNPRFAPGSVGGVENRLFDAHEVSERIESHPEVRNAQAISFQTVYVGAGDSEFVTLAGVGITGTSEPLPLRRGDGFEHRDVHYADGTYEGRWTNEVIVDQATARALGVSVGDTLHIGGTIASARRHEFTVVGISSTFSAFIGMPTVVLHLSELQELTATTRTDPASVVAVTLEDGANTAEVAADLQERYPAHAVRTNREQFAATLKRQAPVIAAVVSLVALALVIGLTLVAFTLTLLVQHQRTELMTLRANGVSSRLLVGTVVLQGIGIGLVGGVLGVFTTPAASIGLNTVVADVTGSQHLVEPTSVILGGGFGIAIGMGILGAGVAAWRVVRFDGVERLR